MRFQISCASRCRRPPVDACVFVEAMIFESDRHAREPLAQFVEPTRQLCACFRRSALGDFAEENYSPEITHRREGDNPEKRLSYIGTTCVAGQRKVPAAVARPSTEYVPDPGSNVSK